MDPLHRLMNTLRTLVVAGDPNGIDLAERAIDEYLALQPDANAKTGALNVLDGELVGLRQMQGEFLELVFACVDNRMRALQDP